ncbi:hypothetical protein [uncultured Methanospirillum sp.]|uniref:hypothetical protein n=1 Tax=uncultured Methanospirillum sp. TaxID=262503 RepID=UPI0029C7F22D|nr:hypothetical protein [uncultured Methanospirillum sp.]
MMKFINKFSMICLVLLLITLIAAMTFAEEASVITQVTPGEVTVITPDTAGTDTDISPVQKEEMNILSETDTALMQGQSSQVYRVTLTCPGTVRMTSSYGSRFTLYAKKSSGSGYCPTAFALRSNYDKVMYGYSGTKYLNLDPGVWCMAVYGSSGSGSYSLRVTSVCPNPTSNPTPVPTPYPCGVYRTDSRQGYLNQGQAAVYGYSIPSDGRSKIEWTMTSTSSPSGGNEPIIAASVGDTAALSSSSSATSLFDLYIFKDCNPKTTGCSTRYYSRGPNSFVSVASPSSGSIYYVMVYARSGSGTFDLKMNSYKCSGSAPIIASASSVQDMASEPEVSAPTAEVVLSEGT